MADPSSLLPQDGTTPSFCSSTHLLIITDYGCLFLSPHQTLSTHKYREGKNIFVLSSLFSVFRTRPGSECVSNTGRKFIHSSPIHTIHSIHTVIHHPFTLLTQFT